MNITGQYSVSYVRFIADNLNIIVLGNINCNFQLALLYLLRRHNSLRYSIAAGARIFINFADELLQLCHLQAASFILFADSCQLAVLIRQREACQFNLGNKKRRISLRACIARLIKLACTLHAFHLLLLLTCSVVRMCRYSLLIKGRYGVCS